MLEQVSPRNRHLVPVGSLVVTGILVTVQLALPADQRGWVILGSLVACILCIIGGIALHSPPAKSFWLLLALSMGSWAIGTSIRTDETTLVGPWDAFFIGGFVLLLAAAGTLGRHAWTRADTYLDTAIVTISLGGSVAVILIEPLLRDAGLDVVETAIMLTYPFIAVFLFAAVLRCAFEPMPRSVSLSALLIALASFAIGASLLPAAAVDSMHPAEVIAGLAWTIGYIALAVAALDPSMRTVLVVKRSEKRPTKLRLVAPGASLVSLPVFILAALFAGVEIDPVLLVAVAGLPLAVLLSARVGMLILDAERRAQAFEEREGLLLQAEQIASLGSWSWQIREDEVRWSDQLYRIFGIDPDDFGATFSSFLQYLDPQDAATVMEVVSGALKTGSFVYSARIVRPDGEERMVDCRGQTMYSDGEAVGMYGIVLDITEAHHEASERRQLEEQLRQAQKMEAVGRLAGGIAHDFNNLLTAIMGHADLVLSRSDLPREAREDIREIEDAAQAGRDVTGALLDIGQSRVVQRTDLDLNEVIASFRPVLTRLLGEDISLEITFAEEPVCVHADRGRLEQVLLNLVVNAREAMPVGGALTVRTDVSTRVPTTRSRSTNGARWAVLSVMDTGTGIDPSDLQRVFEPFFSTKDGTSGRGLGLSIVYGIVTESKGFIDVVPGEKRGTEMRVYLPLSERVPEPISNGEAPEPDPSPAVVLLVEDEPQVRSTTQRVLTSRGYAVLTAGNGIEALEIASAEITIDLLITDVVMPQMNGVALAERFMQMQPRAQVIYMSGYTADVLTNSGLAGARIDFVAKPFRPEELVAKVRQVLGRARESRP